jgi:tetratricopeptide (TPR) repeat protein
VSNVEAAEQALAVAGAFIDARKFREAVEPAGLACRLRPEWSSAWWNYAVTLKHAHRWAECLEACDRAIALDPADSDGMHWNAGIAATALGDWSRAREAWSACGIELPKGMGPIQMKIGIAAVRISPEAAAEVVFCTRIDPCRARILSVPVAESRHRFGDIVLHDGEARGRRQLGDGTVAVFDELLLLEPSAYGTWKVAATCRTPEERDEIVARFDGVDGAIEDWTESLVPLCSSCSLGEPHGTHEHGKDEGWRIERMFGLALRGGGELRRLRRLGAWWRRGIQDVTRLL